MKFRLGMMAAALAVVAFGWVGSTKSTSAVSAPVKFDLAGPEIAFTVSGATQYRVPRGTFRFSDDTFDRRVLVTIYNTKLAAGTVLAVKLDQTDLAGVTTTTSLGNITLSAYGSGRLFLSQDLGDVIPAVTSADNVRLLDGVTMRLKKPTDYKYFQMWGQVSGPPIDAKAPTGRVTYKERDFGYTRSVRMFAQNVNLPGATLNLFRGVNTATDDLIGTCTVSAVRICIINVPYMHDGDAVSELSNTSVLKLRKTDVDETVVATISAWTQVVPIPTP